MVVVVVVGERIGVEAMEVYLLKTGILGGWYLVVELAKCVCVFFFS